ncbi:hypothetical protein [Nocardia sp. NBC_01009]|uniref:hypothetical protein n=1 Tax=Nocardia sp. NBC_01009 TaxID=2975996 RepID=UPI00386E002F|nr:hypothetical protein OHA42_04875 [Nocardia sp. NBC_01009]
MSFLLRRNLPWAWAGWRDLDAAHARPDEPAILPPWRRTNSNRTVWLENNILKIADYSETLFQVGGVSYEQMPFTSSWGSEFDLNIDGNVIQVQYWAAAISPSWARVGFADLIGMPLIAIYRDAVSLDCSIRIMVYRNLSEIETIVSTGTMSGLMNRSWYTLKILVDRDRLVRVYINDVLRLQHWLPADLAAAPGRRGLNFLNQTSAWSEQKKYRLFDQPPDFQIDIGWLVQVVADDFGRPNGPPGNGWTQLGADAAIVSGSWATTGGTDGSRGLIRNTGVTHGAQRVEAVIGGSIAPNGSAPASLVLRTNSTGTSGLIANFLSGSVSISRFTGGLTAPTLFTYTSTPVTVSNGAAVAFSVNGEGAWIEINEQVVLLADLNGLVPGTNSYAGLRVSRTPFNNSASWNAVRILTPF